MSFIDTWRAQIAPSLTEVARHISPEQPFDIGLLTVGIAWPIRAAAHHDAQVLTALEHIVGDDAVQVRDIVRAWPDDHQGAAHATGKFIARKARDSKTLMGRVCQFIGRTSMARAWRAFRCSLHHSTSSA